MKEWRQRIFGGQILQWQFRGLESSDGFLTE